MQRVHGGRPRTAGHRFQLHNRTGFLLARLQSGQKFDFCGLHRGLGASATLMDHGPLRKSADTVGSGNLPTRPPPHPNHPYSPLRCPTTHADDDAATGTSTTTTTTPAARTTDATSTSSPATPSTTPAPSPWWWVLMERVLTKTSQSNERGAAAVEAAIVTPFFLLLIFGIVEASTAILNWNAVHGASREAARIASVGGANEVSDFLVLQEVKSRLRASVADLRYVIVFKAADVRQDPPAACTASAESGGTGVSNVCNVYRSADFARPEEDFSNGTSTQADQNWPAIDRVDWMNGPVDLVGVNLATNHQSLTGIIPSITLRYTTVFAVEASTEDGGL